MKSPNVTRSPRMRSPKKRLGAFVLSVFAGEVAALLLMDRGDDPHLYFYLLLPLFAVSLAILLWGGADPLWPGILLLTGGAALSLALFLPLALLLEGKVPSFLFPLSSVLLFLSLSVLRLPQRACLAAKKREAGKERFGIGYRILDRYLIMLYTAASPSYAYERQTPTALIGRTALSVLFCSGGLLLLRAVLWAGVLPLLSVALFLLLLSPMVLINGLVMGAASALCGTLVLSGLAWGGWIAVSEAMPVGLRVLLWAALLALLPFLFYFSLRYWNRRLSVGASVRREGELLVGVATRCGEYASISEDLRGYARLWRITVTFEPFVGCEEYYLHKRWLDFCLFCKMRGLRPVGYRAQSEPVVTYYLYAKRDLGVEKALLRFFSDWRKKEISVAVREDEEWRGYQALLPSLAAVHRANHELLFSMISPPEGVAYLLLHIAYFPTEEGARAYLEAAGEVGRFSAPTLEATEEGFVALLSEVSEVSMHMMNAKTDALAELSVKYGGEYYSWEVQGAAPPSSPNENKDQTENG